MGPSAKIILDSISPDGIRLTTVELVMHRFILAEMNTHRVFSRNSASSRAIPVEKQLQKVIESPAFPLEWASEQPGMQGGSELEGIDLMDAQGVFMRVWDNTVKEINFYLTQHPDKEHRLHKSLLNRLLEPFMWHTVICSSTDFSNFFNQRCSPLAQPEIRCVAEQLKLVHNNSVPQQKDYSEWHTPYIQENEYDLDIETRKKISVARAARVSYLTHDGKREIEKDIELYERLIFADPPHWSPLEHVATPARACDVILGNFGGWHQLRHL